VTLPRTRPERRRHAWVASVQVPHRLGGTAILQLAQPRRLRSHRHGGRDPRIRRHVQGSGLVAATIQCPDLTLGQISTLFWINTTLGLGITLLTIAMAPAIAWFYGEPHLTSITAVSGLGFLLGGILVQHEALLQRQMRSLPPP
jgi:hypothetical protein